MKRKFKEYMPAKPFLDSHGELVKILVHLLNQSNGLNDGFVLTVDIEFHVVAREGVSQTQFSFVHLKLFINK